MRKTLALVAGITVIASAVYADSVAPQDVKYVDGAVEMPLTTQPGNPEEGAILMNKGSGNCIACHQVTALSDLPFHGEIGPSLDGAADRWSEADLRGIVANAKVMFEGSLMPSFYRTDGFIRIGDAYSGKALEGEVEPLLTAQQIEDVVAFLLTLKDE